MEEHKGGFRSIHEYIATFPDGIQALLQSVRATIKAAAPEAEERISYQLPTFALNGNLVHFGAAKKHIGFYPASSGVPDAFTDELAGYETTKGGIRFPLDQHLPMELIGKIVQFRVAENLNKAAAKSTKKKA